MTLVKTKKKKKETNPNYGGQRPGAGRKSPFAEKTTTVFFTFPESKLEIVNQIMIPLIESWKIKPDMEIVDTLKERLQAMHATMDQFAISLFEKSIAEGMTETIMQGTPTMMKSEEQQPEIVVFDSEDEKGVEVNFPKEDAPLEDFQPIETPPVIQLSQEEADVLIKEAESKYRSGKIVRDVLSNEEYRLGFGLDFDFTRNAVVMGGKSLTGGVYSKVILFINGEWAKS